MLYFFLVVSIAVIVFVLRRRYTRITDKGVTLKSYIVKSANEESNNEYVYPNPTYQDVQVVDQSTDVVSNSTFKDAEDDKNNNIDNQFSVQLEN